MIAMVAGVFGSVALATQGINPPRPLSDIDGNAVALADRIATFRSAGS
jgi:hypothetical protein